MPKRRKQLTFAEFGQQFLERAVTLDVIARTLGRVVPTEQQFVLNAPARVEVMARTQIGAIARQPSDAPDRELVFAVPLQIHLALTVGMLVAEERYTALATTSLRLVARTLAPLTIQIDCDPVLLDDVAVASEGDGNWFDLAKRFGVLDSAIQQQVASMIDQHVHESRHMRTIDVRKLIERSVDLIVGDSASRKRKRLPSRQP
jgi:hypothetical protein